MARGCGYCTTVDDDPRHLSGGTDPGDLPADHHYDCGRENGCVSCIEKTAGAEDLTGDALREHLLKGA